MVKAYILLLCSLALGAMLVSDTETTEVSAEEYAVYSAYLNGIEKNPSDGKTVKLIVINNRTKVIASSCSQGNIAKHNKRIAKDELRPLFEDLQTRSRESVPLQRFSAE